MLSSRCVISEKGYGSERHFGDYRQSACRILDKEICSALGHPSVEVDWLYPVVSEERPEFTGISFLDHDAQRQTAWEDFWPQSGSTLSWDGIAQICLSGQPTWILIEAKANHPEFCSPPCGATSPASRAQIRRSLNETKKALGVHRFFPWEGTYYQYANRLAFLYFLRKIGVSARLVFIYFYGDQFPDGTPCPDSPDRWRELIQACHLTLGLLDRHRLEGWIHEVFLRVPLQ